MNKSPKFFWSNEIKAYNYSNGNLQFLKYSKTWYSNSKKTNVSKDEIEKMVLNKLWIIRPREFKIKKQDFAL